jgi:hypothetical protein
MVTKASEGEEEGGQGKVIIRGIKPTHYDLGVVYPRGREFVRINSLARLPSSSPVGPAQVGFVTKIHF